MVTREQIFLEMNISGANFTIVPKVLTPEEQAESDAYFEKLSNQKMPKSKTFKTTLHLMTDEEMDKDPALNELGRLFAHAEAEKIFGGLKDLEIETVKEGENYVSKGTFSTEGAEVSETQDGKLIVSFPKNG